MNREDFETMDIAEIKDALMREMAFRLYLAIKKADIDDLVKLSDKIVKLLPKLKDDDGILSQAEKELLRRLDG